MGSITAPHFFFGNFEILCNSHFISKLPLYYCRYTLYTDKNNSLYKGDTTMDTVKVMIGGKEMELSHHEVKLISDMYWEKWGKKGMLKFSEYMKNKATSNIADALAWRHAPEHEEEVKHAIANALCIAMDNGDWDLLAEVLYEASEVAAACFSIYSIEDAED